MRSLPLENEDYYEKTILIISLKSLWNYSRWICETYILEQYCPGILNTYKRQRFCMPVCGQDFVYPLTSWGTFLCTRFCTREFVCLGVARDFIYPLVRPKNLYAQDCVSGNLYAWAWLEIFFPNRNIGEFVFLEMYTRNFVCLGMAKNFVCPLERSMTLNTRDYVCMGVAKTFVCMLARSGTLYDWDCVLDNLYA